MNSQIATPMRQPRTAVVWLGRKLRSADLVVTTGRIAVPVVFLAGWELAVRSGFASAFFFSKPSSIASFLAHALATHAEWSNIWTTVQETLWGFLLGSASGIIAGALLATSKRLNAIFDPYVTVLNSLPRVALAPIFLLWFGIGKTSKIALAISLVFFILLINTRLGFQSADADNLVMGRAIGASRFQQAVKIIFPGALPAIFAGLRLGIIYSLLGVVVGEMIAAQTGLGQQLTYYSGVFNIAGLMGILFIIGALAAVLNYATGVLERKVLRWQSQYAMN